MRNRVEIDVEQSQVGSCARAAIVRVIVNGVEVHGVTDFTVDHRPMDPALTLTFRVQDLAVRVTEEGR
jgi:hypothetical protein